MWTLPEFVTRPAHSLIDGWQLKAPLALVLAAMWDLLRRVGGMYLDLLDTDALLVLAVVSLLVLDWITGVIASVKRGEPISSRGFRRAIWKVIEYTSLVAVAVMLANGTAGTPTPIESMFSVFDDAALCYVGVTEGLSVIENVTGSREAAVRTWRRIRNMMRGEWEPQDNDKTGA